MTAEEISLAVEILRTEKQLGKTVRFVSIVLKEPAKDYVRKFSQVVAPEVVLSVSK